MAVVVVERVSEVVLVVEVSGVEVGVVVVEAFQVVVERVGEINLYTKWLR